jgi:hypothetical protein
VAVGASSGRLSGPLLGAHRHGVPIASIARMMKMSVQSVARIVSADHCL